MTTLTLNGSLTLGGILALYRKFSGMEQADMMRHLGVSRATLSAWENDAREPNFSQVVAWARITGQPIEPLIEAVNEKTAPAEAEAVSLSQHSVRLEGLEPPTFWSVAETVTAAAEWLEAGFDAEYQALLSVEAVAL